mmetsp:Transcript_2521/g.5861  ORF Transcript_2521/g.5861 Transcript_2521/m.5861 type:complete len:1341 (-) Transcript_2521:11-4033(-)
MSFAKQYPRVCPPEPGPNGSVVAHWGRSPIATRTLVFPPSGWRPNPREAVVNTFLSRDWVYGINSKVDICVTDEGCVYAVGQLCVVYDEEAASQKYFEGHTADVTALAYNKARNLCVSGQTDPRGSAGPFLCVWSPKFPAAGSFAECRYFVDKVNAKDVEITDNIKMTKGYVCFPERVLRGPVRESGLERVHYPMVVDGGSQQEVPLRTIVACAFTPDGRRVVAMGSDDMNSLLVWDMSKIQNFNASREPVQTYVYRKPTLVVQTGRDAMNAMLMFDPGAVLSNSGAAAGGFDEGEAVVSVYSGSKANASKAGGAGGSRSRASGSGAPAAAGGGSSSAAGAGGATGAAGTTAGKEMPPFRFLLWGNSDKACYFKNYEWRHSEFVTKAGVWGKFPKPRKITGIAYDLSDQTGGSFCMVGDNGYFYNVKGASVTGAAKLGAGPAAAKPAAGRSTGGGAAPSTAGASDGFLGSVVYYKAASFIVGGSSGRIFVVQCANGIKPTVLEEIRLESISGDGELLGKAKICQANIGRRDFCDVMLYCCSESNTFFRYTHRGGSAGGGGGSASAGGNNTNRGGGTLTSPGSHLGILSLSHAGETKCMAIHPVLPGVFVTGATDKIVQFWSATERKALAGKSLRMDRAVCSLAFDGSGQYLAVGMADGMLAVYKFPDQLFQKIVSDLKCEKGGKEFGRMLGAQFSPPFKPAKADVTASRRSDQQPSMYLSCACSDNKIYLLKLKEVVSGEDIKSGAKQFAPQVSLHKTLTGNAAVPYCSMFSADGQYLVTNTRDGQIRVFKCSDGTLQKSLMAFRDLELQQPWTNLLSWQTLGIWAKEYDLSTLDTCCAYRNEHLATGDDCGAVRLFKFPACYVNQPYKEYFGHGSALAACRFFQDLPVLVTVGYADKMITQWRLAEPKEEVYGFQKIQYPWTSFTNGYGDVVDNMLGRQVSYAGDQTAGRNRRRNYGGFDPNNYGPDEIVPFEGDQKLFQDSPPKLKGGSPKSLKRGGAKTRNNENADDNFTRGDPLGATSRGGNDAGPVRGNPDAYYNVNLRNRRAAAARERIRNNAPSSPSRDPFSWRERGGQASGTESSIPMRQTYGVFAPGNRSSSSEAAWDVDQQEDVDPYSPAQQQNNMERGGQGGRGGNNFFYYPEQEETGYGQPRSMRQPGAAGGQPRQSGGRNRLSGTASEQVPPPFGVTRQPAKGIMRNGMEDRGENVANFFSGIPSQHSSHMVHFRGTGERRGNRSPDPHDAGAEVSSTYHYPESAPPGERDHVIRRVTIGGRGQPSSMREDPREAHQPSTRHSRDDRYEDMMHDTGLYNYDDNRDPRMNATLGSAAGEQRGGRTVTL